MSKEYTVASDEPAPHIDAPFRLAAGPGAGKTYWLSEHIKQVLARSTRLPRYSQIACITYTQVGTETLRLRLASSTKRVWISTIHSFLYHHVVRPYAHLLNESDLNIARLDGHDTLRPSVGQGREWLQALGRKEGLWFQFPQLAHNLERNIRWQREGDQWQLGFDKNANWKGVKGGRKAYDGHDTLRAYKGEHWRKGRIDHDDVVYFAARVFQEHPETQNAVTQRFPYVFLDEYQDTSLLQASIVEGLAESGAVVGVIGDRNQSIFEFNDANPDYFDRFSPPGCVGLRIEDNRRSTAQIVSVLNHLRQGDELKQMSTAEKESGARPLILVGPLDEAIKRAQEISDPSALHMMGRSHATVAKILGLDPNREETSPWDQIDDQIRVRFLAALCRGLRQFQDKNAQEAIQEVQALFRGGRAQKPLDSSHQFGRKERRIFCVSLLGELATFAREKPNASALDAYNTLWTLLQQTKWNVKLPKATVEGKFAKQASEVRLSDLIASVPLHTSSGLVRTIHGFKGDEADAILLYLADNKLPNRLLNPKDDENTRLLYVAISRAREHAFIALASLSNEAERCLNLIGFDIQRLTKDYESHHDDRLF